MSTDFESGKAEALESLTAIVDDIKTQEQPRFILLWDRGDGYGVYSHAESTAVLDAMAMALFRVRLHAVPVMHQDFMKKKP